jgi:hypothetical protein
MMNCCFRIVLVLVLLIFCGVWVQAADKPSPPEKKDVDRWAAMLPEKPRGLGPTIEDRDAWRAIAAAENLDNVVQQAEGLLKEPIPQVPDDLFLDYSRTGNRERCQTVLGERQNRLSVLALAECVEARGRFLPALEETIEDFCRTKTWVLPAHDVGLKNFHGTEITIDLRSAHIAWTLATARYWLGDKLSPETRKRIEDELERRAFTPFADMIEKGKPRMNWLTVTNNHNSVCLAGVTGSALATIESRERRALFAASAEKYIQNFLRGFTPDGNCSEGLGYWNYGFGHFTMLAETLRQATGGKVDWLEAANVRLIARFGWRMEILPGIYPAFADCDPDEQNDPQLTAFLANKYHWELIRPKSEDSPAAEKHSSALFQFGLFDFSNLASATQAGKDKSVPQPPRDWFSDAQVLICRPAKGSQHALGAAMKGGHNAEHHNHNDLGSFVVALGKSTPLLDPGAENYTSRTFSAKRYVSNVLNSFGHPVPRVAGRLQETGIQAAARIVKTDFSDERDTLVLDLSAAYKVKELKKLERTFVFSRKDNGKLTVTDAVEFDSPQSFGTALITFDKWKKLTPGRLQVGNGKDDVTVEINVEGGEFQVMPEEIHEDLPNKRFPTRLGIELTKPVTKAEVRLTIMP